jgi:hypothetical protein
VSDFWVINMATGEVSKWDSYSCYGVGLPDGYRPLDEVSGEDLVPLLPRIVRRLAEQGVDRG